MDRSSGQAVSGKGTYYGWFVLIGCFLATLGFGFFLSFGVFYTSLLHEFGWSRAQTGSIVSLANLVAAFGSLAMGGLADRFGPRKVLLLGAALLGLGSILSASSTTLLGWYFSYSLTAGLGWAVIGTVPLTLAVRWFTRRRSLATGITTSGSGMGGTVFPYISAYLIGFFGWRSALYTLGLLFSGLLAVSALIARDRPPRADDAIGTDLAGLGRNWTLSKTMRSPAIWLLFMIFLLGSFSLLVVFTYVPSLSLARGMAPVTSAGALGLLGAVAIAARLSASTMTGKVGTVRALILATTVMSLSTLIPVEYFDLTALYTFSIVYGVGYGLWIAVLPAATGEIFGRSHYGQTWGVVNAGGGVGGLLGPITAGLFLDVGGYDLFLFLMAGAMTAFAAVLSFFLNRTVAHAAS